MSKYGIFKANIFVKRPPLKMLDIIESDNYIGKPLEVFDTAEQAVSKMVLSISLDTFYSNKNYATRKI